MSRSTPTTDRAEIRRVLKRIGAAHFGLYPWHESPNPYVVLLAEVLLQRTKRVVVARVLPAFLDAAGDASALASSNPIHLAAILRPTGLTSRVKRLSALGQMLVELGEVPRRRDELLALPGVGEYVADAVLLYAFGHPTFPLDRNVQRVLTRVIQGHQPNKSISPYADRDLIAGADSLTRGETPEGIRDIHQGVMAVAWSYCGPYPQHADCPVRDLCLFALSMQRIR